MRFWHVVLCGVLILVFMSTLAGAIWLLSMDEVECREKCLYDYKTGQTVCRTECK